MTCGQARAVVLTVAQEAAENAVIPHLTVSEFAALSDGNTIYELTGTITGIYQAYDSGYKNISFYLKDDSREEPIIIYRMSCEGIDHNKVAVGNVITVQGAKASFNSVAQMGQGGVCVNIIEATPAPTISCADNTVTITAVSGASIYYTIDGSDPSTASTKYTSPFPISGTATVQAIAVEANKPQSPIARQDCHYVDPNAGDDVQTPSNVACYTLSTASQKGTNSSYAGNCDVTVNDIKWNVTGNTDINPWRIGGKSISNVDRTVYSKTAYSDALSKVEFVSGTVNATWNSLTLIYSTNSDFSNAQTLPGSGLGPDKTISFIPEGGFPAGCYFKFVLNITNTSTSTNKYVQLKEIRFYGYE